MTYIKYLAFVCLAISSFTSCSKPESIEKVVKDYVSTEVERYSILETVKDKETALAAKPKIEKLASKYKSFSKRIKALQLTEVQFHDYLNMDERTINREEILMNLRKAAEADKEIEKILVEACEEARIDDSSFVTERENQKIDR